MSSQTLLLRPVDAWFFRDGRPYNKLESNQVNVESVFPPPPTTLVGSIRAALARRQGWNGSGRWSEKLVTVLGDGFENIGQLSFSGPWLVRENGAAPEPLFPAPLHLAGEVLAEGSKTHWIPKALLAPGERLHCDIGEVRLPVPKVRDVGDLKEAGGLWITRGGLEKVLAGELPAKEQMVPTRDLWRDEFRVGILRDENKRTTSELENALYSPSYIRLRPGVSLALEVRGLPEDWRIPETFPLGGEGRLAACEIAPTLPLPRAPAETIRQSKRISVTLLTPLGIPLRDQRVIPPMAGEEVPGLLGTKIVSGCVGRLWRLGGWDSLNRRPLPLTPFLPPASTWFCEASPEAIERILNLHGRNIGPRAAYGFGRIVLGAWNNEGVAL
jgi:CRISPR-associated protein Cmr3